MMKKILYAIAFIFILTGCSMTEKDTFPELDTENAIYPSEASTEGKGFRYRLYTEKDVYDEFGDTAIFAELTYVGDEDSIEIYHATSPFHFPIEETTRGFEIDYPMNEPLIATTLEKDKPLREKYSFAGGYSDQDDEDFAAFIQTIVENGFPEGSYIVHGSTQFHTVNPSEAAESDEVFMNLDIGFNVKKGINQ